MILALASFSSCSYTQSEKSEYDQEMQQIRSADQHMAPWGRATEH